MEFAVELDRITDLLSEKLLAWFEITVKNLPNIAVAACIVVLSWALAKLARKVIRNLVGRTQSSKSVRDLFGTMTYLLVFIFGFFVALEILHLDKAVTSLLAGAGVLGLALGFAFQDIASNFISGVCIAFVKPYRVGDIVKTNDYIGTVTAIHLRTTTVTTFEGLEVLVPNRILFTDPMVNYTNTPRRRIDLQVGVSYGDDLQKVEDILRVQLEDMPNRIQERDIEIYFHEFGSSSINLSIYLWVQYPTHKNFLQTRSEAVKRVKSAFDENGITIPFPIRTLDFGIKGGQKFEEMIPETLVHSVQ